MTRERWLVEERIDAEHVTYWLYDDRLDAEHHALTLMTEHGCARILAIGDMPTRGEVVP